MDETPEQLQARHRKEQRELQARITNKKKNATKKTRKFVNDECAELERQLRERQEEEARSLMSGADGADGDDQDRDQGEESQSTVNDLASELGATSLSSPPTQSQTSQPQQQPQPSPQQTDDVQQPKQKRNRQKERLARRAAEQEAAALAAESEAANMTDDRALERQAMAKEFETHALREHEIAPDGHCLFSAVADQLGVCGVPLDRDAGVSAGAGVDLGAGMEGLKGNLEKRQGGVPGYRVVRRAAAEWIAAHREEYEGFMVDEPGGVEGYVSKIRDTAEWGGQLELSALANAYGVEIRVVQGGGRVEVVQPGEEAAKKEEGEEAKTLWLAYYRHGYGLGEHYNSLRKAG